MKTNHYILFAIAALLFACLLLMQSCKTCKDIVEIRDSVRIVEVHTRDTAIITKADSAQIQLLLRCDSTNNVLIEEANTANGERLQLQMKLQRLLNGYSQLSVDCKEDSLVSIIQMQDSIIKENTNHTIVQQVEVVPKFYKNCTIAMWILVVLGVLAIAARILIKIYLKR